LNLYLSDFHFQTQLKFPKHVESRHPTLTTCWPLNTKFNKFPKHVESRHPTLTTRWQFNTRFNRYVSEDSGQNIFPNPHIDYVSEIVICSYGFQVSNCIYGGIPHPPCFATAPNFGASNISCFASLGMWLCLCHRPTKHRLILQQEIKIELVNTPLLLELTTKMMLPTYF